MTAQLLALGEPAPWFNAAALAGNPRYAFDTVGGRWIVMLFLGSGRYAGPHAALELVARNRDLFDDKQACFFGVTVDPGDAAQGRIARALPGIRWFLDYDRAVSIRYGAADRDDAAVYTPHWLLLDPMLRIAGRAAIGEGAAVMAALRQSLTAATEAAAAEPPLAPVLVIPNVFPPALCRHLVELYEQHGGGESGFMRDVDGITTGMIDHSHKRRSDYTIQGKTLVEGLKVRLARVLAPMISRAFQFEATRIERWIVACYDGDEGGHFRAHRDNTTAGTAHRKFACTINLNAEEYDGGDLCFPEFGPRTYRAPTGGAVVFSCSLLHEARPVTRGRRYAFLPFLYDDDGARTRERNLQQVGPELQNYRSGLPAAEQENAA